MGRKLVTVRRVTAIRPIPNADRIQVASVDGWQCVVQVGEFAIGDLGLYFEIDSFLPAEDPRFGHFANAFIEVEGKKGFRVKTIKLRGQMSQGLLMPLAKFTEVTSRLEQLEKEHGGDATAATAKLMTETFEEALKVVKFERPEVKGQGGVTDFYGDLPYFVNRTDQERCQNLPDLFDTWGEEVFQETTKMDGSSMTVYFLRKGDVKFEDLTALDTTDGTAGDQPNGRIGVGSRNKDLVERPGSLFWSVAKKHDLPAKLARIDRNVAIQGELCGSSIQGNFEGFPAGFSDFYLFSVWDMDTLQYLPPKEVERWAKDLGVKHVPVNGYFKLRDVAASVDELVKRADGKGINGKKREGIVLKHVDGGFSFKAISNSYLLKHGE